MWFLRAVQACGGRSPVRARSHAKPGNHPGCARRDRNPSPFGQCRPVENTQRRKPYARKMQVSSRPPLWWGLIAGILTSGLSKCQDSLRKASESSGNLGNRRGHVRVYARQQIMNSSARLKLVSGPGLRPSPRNFESFRDQWRISRLAIVDSKPPDFEIEFQQCGNELLAFLLVAA